MKRIWSGTEYRHDVYLETKDSMISKGQSVFIILRRLKSGYALINQRTHA